jgi:uncharacterized protein GlcG (DUF336 family)
MLSSSQNRAAVGAVPIKVGNETIGGIGVSGAPGGDRDEACANVGLAKIGDRVNLQGGFAERHPFGTGCSA